MALTKLTSNLIEGGTGTDWVTAIQTSNFTAAAGKGYFVNTTSQVLYVTLPVGVVGMEITIQDYAGTFATNKVILNANGSEKIQGSALEGRINTNNATAVLIYQDATKGWTSQDVSPNATNISWATPTGQSLTYSTPSPQSSQGAAAATFPTTTFTVSNSVSTISGTATIAGLPSGITASQTITGSGAGNILTVTLTGTFPAADSLNTNLTLSGLTITAVLAVDYLVVAGGGGGAGSYLGAGGGAGGLRATTTHGGSEAVLSLALATNYTITVGAGGVGGQGSSGGVNGSGGNGSNSVFSPLPTTNFATGGGGGGAYQGTNNSGKNGGSGGGGAYNNGATGAGVSGEGFNGGSNYGASTYSGGGGGGAQEAGNTNGQSAGGDGGNINITGSSLFYAGGGGGAGVSFGGAGGAGGGGAGSSDQGVAGTPNTGGGGGGSERATSSTKPGGAGGSGIVILRYPNSFAISGLSGTTTTVGSDKVTTFTNVGTGNIQFNL